jgi:chitinase
MATHAVITKHTTASFPRPHVLYVVDVTPSDGKTYTVTKRYSDVSSHVHTQYMNGPFANEIKFKFGVLHATIGDAFELPPKRILTTTFLPSAWVDDKLIAERESGLSAYLSSLLSVAVYAEHPAVVEFLAPTTAAGKAVHFNAEDALPSTLSRKDAAALQTVLENDEVHTEATFVAASYYPYWAVDVRPPESIDFSKFDILFFGKSLS